MPLGLLGRKLGMTHVYDQYGRYIAVTAIEAGPCTITKLRKPKTEGYQAIQVGFGEAKVARLSKSLVGQFKNIKSGPFKYVKEFRVTDADLPKDEKEVKDSKESQESKDSKNDSDKKEQGKNGGAKSPWVVGQQLTVDIFSDNEIVDVTGTSIGKGFQGGMKRWGWSGGPKSHGSTSHRRPGSIGTSATPSRVLRGRHLPGHMGNVRVTVQNVRVIKRDKEANLIFVEGGVPGPRRSLVMIRKSAKFAGVIKKGHAIEHVVEVQEEEKPKAKAAEKKPEKKDTKKETKK